MSGGVDGEAIATLKDDRLEVAVFPASYGFVAVVRYIEGEHLGTNPFHNLAEAMAYAKLMTRPPVANLPAAEFYGHMAAHTGEMAILYAHARFGEWVGLHDARQPSACGPYFAYVTARRTARAAFLAKPELREYPRNLGQPGADRNKLCTCGHVLAFHVADRLPCLVPAHGDEEACTCRAFKRAPQA